MQIIYDSTNDPNGEGSPFWLVAYSPGEPITPPPGVDMTKFSYGIDWIAPGAGFAWSEPTYGGVEMSFDDGTNGSYPTGRTFYQWTIQWHGWFPSGFASGHHLGALEYKLANGTPLNAAEMAFLEGTNGYGRGASIAPAGWIAGQQAGNQWAIWNDFVTRIEDLEAGGDFLGIKGLGQPDDWGPLTVILAAVTAGVSEYFSAAVEVGAEAAVEGAAQVGASEAAFAGAGELAEVPALTIAPEAEAAIEVTSSTATIAAQAEPIAASSSSSVLQGAADAPLAESTVTLPDGLVEVELPAIPDLGAEDLQAIQDAAGASSTLPSLPNPLPPAEPVQGAVDAPLTSSSTIAPPQPFDVALEVPAIPELPLPEITVAAASGGALGSLSIPTLSSAVTAAKKLLAGGGGTSSSSGPSRSALTPADFTVDPSSGDTWLRPDATGTVSQTQFAMFATVLLALSSVFFIK